LQFIRFFIDLSHHVLITQRNFSINDKMFLVNFLESFKDCYIAIMIKIVVNIRDDLSDTILSFKRDTAIVNIFYDDFIMISMTIHMLFFLSC